MILSDREEGLPSRNTRQPRPTIRQIGHSGVLGMHTLQAVLPSRHPPMRASTSPRARAPGPSTFSGLSNDVWVCAGPCARH